MLLNSILFFLVKDFHSVKMSEEIFSLFFKPQVGVRSNKDVMIRNVGHCEYRRAQIGLESYLYD